jgi:hypothetical protein
MNISQRILSAGVVISAAAFVVTGCAAPTQEIPKAQESTSTESILTEVQALALAEKTYTEYLAISDQIARDGGEGVERLKGLVSAELFDSEAQGFEEFRESGFQLVGQSSFTVDSVQNETISNFTTYVCLDRTAIKIQKNGEVAQDSESVSTVFPLVVEFRPKENNLIIESSTLWTGENFCS